MVKKNPYLAKREQERLARDMIVAGWAQQEVFDALTLVLNDKEVMGKDVFGEERLMKLCVALNAKVNEIRPGLSHQASASHVRRQVDDELQKICKKTFVPWEERYIYWDDRGI